MKLAHAVKVVEKSLGRVDLSSDERIALTVLARLARRVLDARPSFKAVNRAIEGEDDLNQDDLFKPE